MPGILSCKVSVNSVPAARCFLTSSICPPATYPPIEMSGGFGFSDIRISVVPHPTTNANAIKKKNRLDSISRSQSIEFNLLLALIAM